MRFLTFGFRGGLFITGWFFEWFDDTVGVLDGGCILRMSVKKDPFEGRRKRLLFLRSRGEVRTHLHGRAAPGLGGVGDLLSGTVRSSARAVQRVAGSGKPPPSATFSSAAKPAYNLGRWAVFSGRERNSRFNGINLQCGSSIGPSILDMFVKGVIGPAVIRDICYRTTRPR